MYISRSLILHFYRVEYLHLRRICILLFHNKLTEGMVTYSIKAAPRLPHKNQWNLGIRYSSSALQYFNIRRMRLSSYSIYNKINLKNETSLFEEHTVLLVIWWPWYLKATPKVIIGKPTGVKPKRKTDKWLMINK